MTSRAHGLCIAAQAYFATRLRQLFWRTKSNVENFQRRKLAAFLSSKIQQVDEYSSVPAGTPLAALPVIDKATLMAAFHRFNTPRVTAADGWRAFGSTNSIGNYIVGASTGTSGNRGLFVISQTERFQWLGILLAKALPGFWYRRERVAIILPLNTPLYDSANETGLLKLKFFDITEGLENWLQTLLDFNPTVIVAPPKLLRQLAGFSTYLHPNKLFSAAETLDSIDRELIESSFGLPLGQIYMATEGLLAVSCKHGTLHLCEDVMHFELKPFGDDLVSPIITDFSRTTQIMARYSMNDLLRLQKPPCPCGSPLQAISEVVGRCDDCFILPTKDGGNIMITPDILRNTVLDSDRSIQDFRMWQTGADEVTLVLGDSIPECVAHAALAALKAFFDSRSAVVRLQLLQQKLIAPTDHKLRRVENKTKGLRQGEIF
jgi:putative adenylate-forming enzyme